MRTKHKSIRRILVLCCLGMLISLGLAPSAQAQRKWLSFGWEENHHEEREHARFARERGYQNGYTEGSNHGRIDGSRGFAFDYANKRDYQVADEGFRREYGDRFAYQEGYRDGFARGYESSYQAAVDERHSYWHRR